MLRVAADTVAGVTLGWICSSYFESYYHDRIQHGSVDGWLHRTFFVLVRGVASHETVHHFRSFRKSHVEQFESPEKQKNVDEWLDTKWPIDFGPWVRAEEYGVTITFLTWLAYALLFLIFQSPILIFGSRIMFFASIFPLVIISSAPGWLHRYYHMPFSEALQCAPWYLRPIIQSSSFRQGYQNHFLHHKTRRFNFNLTGSVGDWMRGVYREPTDDERRMIRKHGIQFRNKY